MDFARVVGRSTPGAAGQAGEVTHRLWGLGREEVDVDIARVGVVWRVAVVVIGGRLGP